MTKLVNYLAYGSNIAPERLIERGIKVSPSEKVLLQGYRLVFNIKDQFHPDIGYANLEIADSHVEAALYEISRSDLTRLGQFEQEYNQIEIAVEKEDGSVIEATSYIGKSDWIGKNLKPPTWYINYFLSQEDFFSDEYLKWLRGLETIEQNEQRYLDGKYGDQ